MFSLGDVRALMVVVERLVIGAFEAHSCELPRLHVIPGARHHDLGRDVRGIGNVPARRELRACCHFAGGFPSRVHDLASDDWFRRRCRKDA